MYKVAEYWKMRLIVPERLWQFLLGAGALVVVLVGLSLVVGWLKKRFHQPPAALTGSGWTLEQVKKLHESGELTDEQHKRLREEIVKVLKR